MKRSPKKGPGKGQEMDQEEPGPTQISQGDESTEEIEEEELEEAQVPLPREGDEPTAQEVTQAEAKGDIFVTLAVYSKKYKDLSAIQFKAGAVEAKGHVDLGVGVFGPGEIHRLTKNPASEKLLRDGYLIRMSGSFGKRATKKEADKK